MIWRRALSVAEYGGCSVRCEGNRRGRRIRGREGLILHTRNYHVWDRWDVSEVGCRKSCAGFCARCCPKHLSHRWRHLPTLAHSLVVVFGWTNPVASIGGVFYESFLLFFVWIISPVVEIERPANFLHIWELQIVLRVDWSGLAARRIPSLLTSCFHFH